jgi:hypothetical protein
MTKKTRVDHEELVAATQAKKQEAKGENTSPFFAPYSLSKTKPADITA